MVVFRVRIKLMAIFRVSVTVRLMVKFMVMLKVCLPVLTSSICLHLYVEKNEEKRHQKVSAATIIIYTRTLES